MSPVADGPISAVIFDLGGVMTASPVGAIEYSAQRAGVPVETLNGLMAEQDGLWERFETGDLDEAAFVRAFEAQCATRGLAVDARAFLEHFFSGLTLRPEMLAVADALRGRYRLGCITNNVQRSTGREPRIHVWEDVFEVVVESSKVGMRKPDPRIYHHCCTLLGVEPESCVFLDDFGVNLKAARALGMTTIKVDSTHRAIAELEAVLGHALPRPGV